MLLLSMVFFLCAFVISVSIHRYYAPQKVSARLTREIAASLTDLESEIQKVSARNMNDKNSFLEYLDDNYKNAFKNRGIEILIYKNDSLKFWSANVLDRKSVV